MAIFALHVKRFTETEAFPEDNDLERKTQAEVLLNAYSRELERQKLAAEAQGLVITGEGKFCSALILVPFDNPFHSIDDDIDDDDDDEEEFQYPMSPTASIRASSRSSSSTGYFSRPESHRTVTDLTPQLSQSPDFRVPTHEAPQKVARWAAPSPHQIHRWEKDEDVIQCRDCERRFNFITRRVSVFTPPHHCRRC